MAIKNNKSNNEREKISYKWGNSGPSFWQEETVLQTNLRKSEKGNYELILKIQNLDENRKFIKNEDDTYDNGYINLTAYEIAKVNYQLEQMFPMNNLDNGTIGGIIINHISSQTNNGSQLEIVAEDEGIFVYITYVVGGEVSSEYRHQLSNDQDMRFYNANGKEDEKKVNLDLIAFKQLFTSAYALVSGLVDSAFEVNGISTNGRGESKSGGKITGGLNRKVRSTLGAKRAEEISEDDEDEAPVASKKTNKKTTSKITKSANMKSLLEEDEDEEE